MTTGCFRERAPEVEGGHRQYDRLGEEKPPGGQRLTARQRASRELMVWRQCERRAGYYLTCPQVGGAGASHFRYVT